MTTEQISVLARQEGLSYGQYVFRHAHELHEEKPERVAAHLRRCAWCGRAFGPKNRRQRFCSVFCRLMGQREERARPRGWVRL